MVFLMHSLLGAALKTNDSLEFAVLRCLRIPKESIFTGLNNLRVLSITNDRCDLLCANPEREPQNCRINTSGNDVIKRFVSQASDKTRVEIETPVAGERKKSFYHGVMLGVLMSNGRMSVISNREAGEGYADILVKSEDGETGIVIKMKYAGDGELDAACRDAIGQIDERRYTDAFKYTRVRKILKYGVGCYRKSCRVMTDG